MKCPRCQHENPPQGKFCIECAAPLAQTCGKCGTALPAGAKFCPECSHPAGAAAPDPRFASPEAYTPKHLAERILTSRSALEGERKQVTVLFADVSGFTSLSERLDPEDVHGLMTRIFELMLAEVHRYEGTVNQFLGDGIMALFGAPIAHEDHGRRAVHAALGIRKALDAYQDELRSRKGVSFQVRQGLNTGLVVVGSIGSDLRMDYTAVGDTTNVAARLQQAADPGRIVISEATHRVVEGYFYARPLGELPLKGKAEPIRAWEVISARAARSRLEVEAERGLTPFVGRERELQLLLECFEKVKAGQGQVVFLVGEPGIGKSRLLYEFRRRLGEEATWLEGRCMSFGRSMAFHPVIDMVRGNFKIEEGDTEETMAKKIERGVILLGEDLRPIVPYLRYLLSINPGAPAVLKMEPRQRRGEIFDALRRLLVRASEVRPQVFVHEDVHWMDKATEEGLLFSVDSIPRNRILQILTYRTGYQHPFGEHTYHTRIGLTALSQESTAQMAQAVLAAGSVPEDLQRLIAAKAEGNPLFVEEIVKSLHEVGAIQRAGDTYVLAKRVDEIVVPDSLQDVIMARIDRLEEAPKRTLQLASVIGREFTRRLLDRISEIRERTEECVQALTAIELIYEKSLFPELAYMFKHALTHDVAYKSLLIQRRKELHRLIGLAIEELYADRVAEHYAMLAHHFSKAEEWPKALDYLLKAAEKAGGAFAIRESLALYDQALEVAGQLGEKVPLATRMMIHRARSFHYFTLGEYVNSRIEAERAVAFARQGGDRAGEASALAWASLATQWAHDFEQALGYARQAIEVAEQAGIQAGLARAHLTIGNVHAICGRLEQGSEKLDQAIMVSRAVGDAGVESMALQIAAFVKSWQGLYAEASQLSAEAVRIVRERNLLSPLLRGLWAQGLVMASMGDYARALAVLEEGLALNEKVGDESFVARYLNTLGWLWGECEDLDRALDMSEAAAKWARTWRHAVGVEMTAYSEINRGDALIAKGELASAGDILDEIHHVVRNPSTHEWMKWRYSAHLFVSLGEFGLARGELRKGSEFADQSLEIATRTNSRKYIVRGLRLKGEIAIARRQRDEAETALRQAVSIAKAIGNPPQLWKTHVALGRLHGEAGRPEMARREFQAAREVIDRMKQSAAESELRASLERAPVIRQVYNLTI